MKRIYTALITAILTALALGTPFFMTANAPEVAPIIAVKSENNVREVTFINNIADISHYAEWDEEELEALKLLIKNMTIYINGQIIFPDKPVVIDVKDNNFTLKVNCSESDILPFLTKRLGTLGSLLFWAPYVAGEIQLQVTLLPEEDEINAIYPLIERIEQWQTKWPNYQLSLARLFPLSDLTLHLLIHD